MNRVPSAFRSATAVLVTATLLHTAPAAAQWTGRGEAGAVIASGNTETTAANAKVLVRHRSDPWSQQLGLNAVYASNAMGTTAQRWEAFGQNAYQFNARDFSFGGLRYESDRFSGFAHQGTASVGVGRKFQDTPDYLLTAQVGVGYKFFERRAVYSAAGTLLKPADSGNALAGIANVDFRRQLNTYTAITDKLTVEYTSDNTFLQNELALQVKMSDKLAVALGYAVRYNTDPPGTFGKSDTLTTANLVYEVK